MNDTERPIAQQKSQPVYWIFQLTGWGFYTLSRFVGGLTVMHLPWLRFGLHMLLVDAIADSDFPICLGTMFGATNGARCLFASWPYGSSSRRSSAAFRSAS